MNVVSIKGKAPDSDVRRFCGSGFLVGPSHVLTARHVLREATLHSAKVWIDMLPDCGEPLEVGEAIVHPADLDACLLRVASWEAPSELVFPTLMDTYLPLARQAVELRAVTPVMPRVTAIPLTVALFDQATFEYEVAPQVSSGNSGGAVLHDNVVIGLMTRRVENQPIARFLSMHVLVDWIRSVLQGGTTTTESPEFLAPAGIPVSPEGSGGLCHRIGSIHLHVDGAQARMFIEGLVERHRRSLLDAELAWVVRAEKAPQSEEKLMRSVYSLHDPGELDFFSTTHLHPGPELPTQVQRRVMALETHDILCELHGLGDAVGGAVVELERVVGVVGVDGNVLMASELEMRGTCASLETQQAMQLFVPFNTLDQKPASLGKYELHFSIDVDKTPETSMRPPVALEDLRALAQTAGVEQGGWFLFHDERRWAYRSNAFVSSISKMALSLRWQRLRKQLSDSPNPALQVARLRLVAEEALAVWRAPLMLRDGYRTVSELISWERDIAGLRDFWVVLPNFLGDQSDEMRQTMQRNLVRGVRYTYFLSSHADAKRWLIFRDELVASGVRGAQRLMTAYVVAFACDGPLASIAAFIANPGRDTAQGYELTIDSSTNRVLHGVAMEPSRMVEVTAALSTSTGSNALTDWHLVQPTGPDVTVTAACVKLIARPDDDEVDALIDDLDNSLAVLASQHGGSVELYGSRSITVVFVGNRPALGLALAFVREVLKAARAGDVDGVQGPVRIGLAHGRARLAARASGRIWNGPAIRACHRVLEAAPLREGIFVAPQEPGQPPPFEPGTAQLETIDDDVFELIDRAAPDSRTFANTPAAAGPVQDHTSTAAEPLVRVGALP